MECKKVWFGEKWWWGGEECGYIRNGRWGNWKWADWLGSRQLQNKRKELFQVLENFYHLKKQCSFEKLSSVECIRLLNDAHITICFSKVEFVCLFLYLGPLLLRWACLPSFVTPRRSTGNRSWTNCTIIFWATKIQKFRSLHSTACAHTSINFYLRISK